MKPDSGRLVAIDAACVLLISAAICVFCDRLVLMTLLVPLVVSARMLALAVGAGGTGVPMRAEIAFFVVCTLLGAFNDWNSVCNKKIYDYTVPHFFTFSTIPLWMLLFWGMILRFLARLARWGRLGAGEKVSNSVGFANMRAGRPVVKIAAELILVAATRWAVYRFYLDPVLSWLPFGAALALFFLFFGPTRHDVRLLAVMLVIGPVAEILYIGAGGLHFYHIGWIGGVPLWIVLWWALGILVWKDLAFRIEMGLRRIARQG